MRNRNVPATPTASSRLWRDNGSAAGRARRDPRSAKWTRPIPDDYRDKAEEILVAAARAGADLRSLAAICAEIRYQTAEHDPDDEQDKDLDRGVV